MLCNKTVIKRNEVLFNVQQYEFKKCTFCSNQCAIKPSDRQTHLTSPERHDYSLLAAIITVCYYYKWSLRRFPSERREEEMFSRHRNITGFKWFALNSWFCGAGVVSFFFFFLCQSSVIKQEEHFKIQEADLCLCRLQHTCSCEVTNFVSCCYYKWDCCHSFSIFIPTGICLDLNCSIVAVSESK